MRRVRISKRGLGAWGIFIREKWVGGLI